MPGKVCIITTVHRPFDTRIFHKEAKTLVNAGYEVTLIAQNDKDIVVDGIKIIALPKPKNRLSRIFALSWKAYKFALKQNADVYHFHDPEFLLWANSLKKNTSAKVIYDVHEDYPADILTKAWIPNLFRKLLSKIFGRFEKNIVRKMDFIITAIPKIKNDLYEIGIKNVEVIYNFPLLEYFYIEKKSKYIYKNLNKPPIRLIYVGGITLIRGIEQIVKSLIYLRNDNVKLILIGNFQEKRLSDKLKSLSEWNKVEYKGWLSQKEAYKAMQNANIGLLCFLPAPNHMHAIPNKLFEYMAAGIPVIASNFYLLKKIINQNNCGICVDPENPKEIAESIEYLIEHPEKAKEMGENGKEAVLKKFNWDSESKKIINIYSKLVNL